MEIGDPIRTVIIEPAEDPVPAHEPEPDREPDREREPEKVPA